MAAPSRASLPNCPSYDARLGDGDDEPAAAGAVLGLLLEDLLGEVPRQQQRVVRLVLEQLFDRPDPELAAWHVAAVLERIAVDHVVEDVGAEAAVAEQRGGFGGGAVPCDAAALRLEPIDHAAQLLAQPVHALREAQVGLGTIEAGSLLGLEQRLDRRLRVGALADIDAQRAAVDRQPPDVVDAQA